MRNYYPLINSMGSGAVSSITNDLIFNYDISNSLSYSGGTSLNDLSGNSINATLVNCSYSNSNGGSIVFNQVNAYILLPTNLSTYFSNKNKLTYDIWVKVNNPSLGEPFLHTLFSYGDTSQYANDIMFFVLSNKLYVNINNGADGGCILTYNSTSWVNISIVYDGTQSVNSDRIKVYYNGVLQTINTTYTIPSTTSAINMSKCGIGAYSCNDFNNCHLGGNVGSSRMYSNALTQTGVIQNFNATKTRFGF